jgi:predicted RNA-binding protein YlxR (DUF448 family)
LIYAGDHSPTEKDATITGTTRDESACESTATSESMPEQATDAPYVKPVKVKPLPVCIHSGKALEEERMMRFVIGPEDVLYPDFAGDLPGKPMWCSLYRETLQEAVRDNSFAKASGKTVNIPENIMDQIDKGLRHQALAMLSMCKKSGHLLTGAEKTEQVLKSGKAGIYLTAAAKDADTREKLSFLARNARVVDMFTSDELSKASGANKVFHAAMTRGGTTERFFSHVKRMNLFRNQTNDPKQQADKHDR